MQKIKSTKLLTGLVALFLLVLMASFTLDDATKAKYKNAEENENCLKCHGQAKYTFTNPGGDTLIRRMYTEAILNRDFFYSSNHGQFKCTDCHAQEYDSFPHPGNLRMESQYACMDCHGDDPKYAKFHFEDIQSEFEKSVHSQKLSKEFSCWMCHDPHTYKSMARSKENIKNVVAYANEMCLKCHADQNNYQLFSTKENPNIIKKHDWLPNQELHFRSVRCIDCHATGTDSTLVAHNIQPKEKAVKRCVECHSTNSMLMGSLYKYQVKEGRNKAGFYNGVIMNEGYVIGANRNYYLGIISIIMFACVLLGVAIHTTLRIINKKK